MYLVESYGDLHGHPYIAMECVEGTDLYQEMFEVCRGPICPSGGLVWKSAHRSVSGVGLHSSTRLIHRDLKPSNVLINTDGECNDVILGLSKSWIRRPMSNYPPPWSALWAYASPEQISGRALDHRSDLYSLGVILYTMLTGRRPFVAEDMSGYLEQHQKHDPKPPIQLVPGTSN